MPDTKKETALVNKATNEVLTSQSLEEAVKECIKSGDEASLAAWTYNTVLTTSTTFTLAVDEAFHQMELDRILKEMGKTKEELTPRELIDIEKNKIEPLIDGFHGQLRDILVTLGQVQSYGNIPMTPKDMEVLGEIAKAKYPEEKRLVMIKKLGIALPTEVPGVKMVDQGDVVSLKRPKKRTK